MVDISCVFSSKWISIYEVIKNVTKSQNRITKWELKLMNIPI
jgi:hypothetical protein